MFGLIPRVHAYYDHKELIASVPRVGQKRDIARLENEFAGWAKHEEAVLFPYSRTALIMILKLLGIRNKEIIMPAYTCCAVSHAIVKSGNKPRFVDNEQGQFNCSWDGYANAVSSETGAAIGMHLFGVVMADTCTSTAYDALRPVPIMHDRTLAIGTPFNTEDTVLGGICSYYGLSLSKQFCMVEGGMVITQDRDFARGLRALRDRELKAPSAWLEINRYLFFLAHYLLFTPGMYGTLKFFADHNQAVNRRLQYYDPATIDLPSDIYHHASAWEASIGLMQIGKLHEMNTARRKIAQNFVAAFKDLQTMRCFVPKPEECPSHFILFCERRDNLVQRAKERGVDIGVHFDYVIPDLPAYERFGQRNLFPNATALARTVCNVPLYPGLKRSYQEHIIRIIRGIDDEFANG